MLGLLNPEPQTSAPASAVKDTHASRTWICVALVLLIANAYQFVAGQKLRQRDSTMQSAIAESGKAIKSAAVNVLRLSNRSCPPEIPPITPSAAAYNLKFALPCQGQMALAPLEAASLIHARRMLEAARNGESNRDDTVDDDLVYVEHLRRALTAIMSGKTTDLNQEERTLLKEIESADSDAQK
jgi:hypothetical protein